MHEPNHAQAAHAPARHVVTPNDLEARVLAILVDSLACDRLDADAALAGLVGHPVAAARISARIADDLGVSVPVARILAAGDVRSLARAVGAAAPIARPVRHVGRDSYPLTDLQREQWTLRRMRPDSTATTVALRLRVTGLQDAAPLRAALDGLVRRHEVLRTVVVETVDGALACVRPAVAVPVEEHDVRDLSAAAVERLVEQAARHAFDVELDVPLMHATVLWAGPDEADVVLTVDHLGFDGCSAGVLLPELAGSMAAMLDGAPDPGEEPALQVGDVALFELAQHAQPGRLEELRGFWRSELDGVTPPYSLSWRPVSPAGPRSGARVARRLDPRLVDAVERVAREAKATPFAVYVAGLASLVGALSSDAETVIGAAAARREHPGLDGVIGPLVDVLPLRLPTAASSFTALVQDAFTAVSRALAHRDLPAAELARCAHVVPPPGAGLTPVLVSMQPSGMAVSSRQGRVGVELLGELSAGGAVCDLTFLIQQTATGPAVQLEYDVDRFDAVEAARLLDRLVCTLEQATAHPERSVASIEIVDDDERTALLALGRGAALPPERVATVLEAVISQATARPDDVAVVGPSGSARYGELEERSAGVAHLLSRAGVGTGDVVAACLPREQHAPAALLGIWRAGAAYLPLDPALPPARLRSLVADAGARGVLATEATLALARSLGVDDVWNADAAGGTQPGDRLPDPDADRLAYVIYTSGSTGRPKGVEVTHASLAAFVAAMHEELGFTSRDVMLAAASLSFDVSASELWVPLASGGRVVVADDDDVIDGYRLSARIAGAGVTVVDAPPTQLRALLAAGWEGGSQVRVITGGEPVDPALARELLGAVGEVWNAYGPTETTINATMHRVGEPLAASVPIGRPIAGMRAYVVDHLGRLLPWGAVGELWLAGAGVATGYRDRPDLTAAAFGADPFGPAGRVYRTGDRVRWLRDGRLDFVGRRDHQVKLRGYRIELAEIESVLREQPEVRHAAVSVHGTGPAAELVAYVVPCTTGDVQQRVLGDGLREPSASGSGVHGPAAMDGAGAPPDAAQREARPRSAPSTRTHGARRRTAHGTRAAGGGGVVGGARRAGDRRRRRLLRARRPLVRGHPRRWPAAPGAGGPGAGSRALRPPGAGRVRCRHRTPRARRARIAGPHRFSGGLIA